MKITPVVVLRLKYNACFKEIDIAMTTIKREPRNQKK